MNDWQKKIDPTPSRRPWREGGLLMGTKNFEIMYKI
jgi:hypothetical protein